MGDKAYKFKLDYGRRFLKDFGDEWHADGRLAKEGMKAFWDISVEAGDVKEPWPDSRWLNDTFLKTQNQWLKGS